MKILIDFFPILLFFAAYKIYDIYVATTVLMVGTVMQMSLIYAIDKKLQMLHKVTLLMVLGFGTLTLALHDERFVKWKPTVIWAVIGIGLAYAIWVRKTNFLKSLLSSQLELPDFVWRNLSISWVPFCAFMSLINAYVVVNYSTEAWVNFKLWGYLFWPVFLVGQGVYMSRYLKADEPSP